jgi:hypothetical protein
MVPKLGGRLRRSLVVAKQAAEPPMATDRSRRSTVIAAWVDQSIVEPLVIPLPVIVLDVFADDLPKMAFAEGNHLSDAL